MMAKKSSERGRILWADDEVNLLKPHIRFLEEQGYEVTAVYSGEEAIHEVDQGNFNLVLLDEMMAGMDGLQTLQEIKLRNPVLPVIMITKNEEEWLMDEAIAANIAGYLTKPVNPSQIFMACKSMLEQTRIRSDKATSRYLEEFQELSNRVDTAEQLDDWLSIFHDLTNWDVEFDKHRDLGLDQLLSEQHITANQRFGQFISSNYLDLLNGSNDHTFSHEVLQRYVWPHLDNDTRVVLVVIDCLRLDHWRSMRPLLEDRFSIDEQTSLSILPTATPFSRNAIFSGLLPDQLPIHYPEEWGEMQRDETSMNKFESKFLEDQLKRDGYEGVRAKYFKLITAEEGQRLLGHLSEYRSANLLAMVANFVDMLAHHRAESDVIKEMLPNESGYRSTICSWIEKSWMRDLLDQLVKWEDTVVIITSDHGSIQVDKPVRLLADRMTSSGVRYKYGRNLNCPDRMGLNIKRPGEYHLPADDVTTNFVIARDRNFFVYPTEYHKYVKRFEGSFQHGGISLEEMIVPLAILRPRGT
jgi:DNA-binding response OmpR family regulator